MTKAERAEHERKIQSLKDDLWSIEYDAKASLKDHVKRAQTLLDCLEKGYVPALTSDYTLGVQASAIDAALQIITWQRTTITRMEQ